MTRVLLVCPERVRDRHPAGVGIRFLEMANVLRADGHVVTLLSPDDGGVEPASLAAQTASCDVAVVQGHIANELFAHGANVPTVVDLYDPYIIENLHYHAERGPEVFQHDHATLMQSLRRGDTFLCASEAQRMFYLGMLLAIGRLNPLGFAEDPRAESLLRVAPFGVQAPTPSEPRTGSDLLFGGIYDWYDPVMAIEAVAIARQSAGDVSLTFNAHPNPETTPQGKTGEAMRHVKRRGYGEFIRFEPWVPYDGRGEYFQRFRLALLAFPQSVETDLSMRTRVYDYLWGGLPVITSPAPGTDELLARYDAGCVVRTSSVEGFAAAIVALLHNEARYRAMLSGARRFAADHQWPRTLAPLREFCRAPRFDETKSAFTEQALPAHRGPSIFDRLRRRIGGTS